LHILRALPPEKSLPPERNKGVNRPAPGAAKRGIYKQRLLIIDMGELIERKSLGASFFFYRIWPSKAILTHWAIVFVQSTRLAGADHAGRPAAACFV
jgi:hypothetical protein